MTTELDTYRTLLREKYAELDRILDGLPDEALLWRPFEESPWRGAANVLGFIVAHALSSTVYLLARAEWTLGRRAWSDVDGDEGSEEFGLANHQVAYLRERVWRTHATVDAFLGSLSPHDLDASATHPDDPARTLQARYDVVHSIEHLSEHIGQAQITRQLWALESA